MATSWLRLWHEMPNDPKWRTISRAAKQPISAVICVYLHLLVDASANATERGRTQSLFAEDIGSALDLETADVEAILAAMQGRVLDGDRIKGWERRQPAREDGSAERARAWRERKKAEATPHDGPDGGGERNRTQANAEKRPDTDTDIKAKKRKGDPSNGSPPPKSPPPESPDPDPDLNAAHGSPFTLPLTWEPNPKILKAYALNSRVSLADFTSEVIGQFCTHHHPNQEVKTEGQWVAALVGWVRNAKTRQASRVVPLRQRANGGNASDPPDFHDPRWANGELEDLP